MCMLARLAGFTVRRRRRVLLFAVVAFVVSGAIGGGVAEHLSSGGFEDPDAESTVVEHVLADQFDTGTPNVLLLVQARNGDVNDPAVAAAGQALADELGAEELDGVHMTE